MQVRINTASVAAETSQIGSVAKRIETATSTAGSTLLGLNGFAGIDPMAEEFTEGTKDSGGYDSMALSTLQEGISVAHLVANFEAHILNLASGYRAIEIAGAEGSSNEFASMTATTITSTATTGHTAIGDQAHGTVLGDVRQWIEDFLKDNAGIVWPNADTAKVRSAASAWSTYASSLRSAKSTLSSCAPATLASTFPQKGTVSAVQTAIVGYVGNAADNADVMNDICTDYAGRVDDIVAELESMVAQIVVEVVASIGLGVALSWLTAGASVLAAAGAAAKIVFGWVPKLLSVLNRLKTLIQNMKRTAAVMRTASIGAIEGVISGTVANAGTQAAFAAAGQHEFSWTDVGHTAISSFIGGGVAGPFSNIGSNITSRVPRVMARTGVEGLSGGASSIAGDWTASQITGKDFNLVMSALTGTVTGAGTGGVTALPTPRTPGGATPTGSTSPTTGGSQTSTPTINNTAPTPTGGGGTATTPGGSGGTPVSNTGGGTPTGNPGGSGGGQSGTGGSGGATVPGGDVTVPGSLGDGGGTPPQGNETPAPPANDNPSAPPANDPPTQSGNETPTPPPANETPAPPANDGPVRPGTDGTGNTPPRTDGPETGTGDGGSSTGDKGPENSGPENVDGPESTDGSENQNRPDDSSDPNDADGGETAPVDSSGDGSRNEPDAPPADNGSQPQDKPKSGTQVTDGSTSENRWPNGDTIPAKDAPNRYTQNDVQDALDNAPRNENGDPIDHRNGRPLNLENADGNRGWEMRYDPETGNWIAENRGSGKSDMPLKGEPGSYGYDENGDLLPYSDRRPSYAADQVETVWNDSRNAQIDEIKDAMKYGDPHLPLPGDNQMWVRAHPKSTDPDLHAFGGERWRLIEWRPGEPRQGIWDMGHVSDARYRDLKDRYMNGMSEKDFLAEFRNPDNYQVQDPSRNRSRIDDV